VSQSQFASAATIPGKIFLLGEYAVLGDRPALIAAVGPRFGMSFAAGDAAATGSSSGATSGPSSATDAFHPASPAGRLTKWAQERGIAVPRLRFDDPHAGAGGFGASTAQFALLYLHIARESGAKLGLKASALDARALYRELMRDEKLRPSGADLVAQWSGGVTGYDPATGAISDHYGDFDWRQLLIFSATGVAGRKTATHEHLERMAGRGFPSAQDEPLMTQLGSIVRDVTGHPGDLARMGLAFGRYADALHEAGLEIEATFEDRRALARIPGVLGAKGAGALQSDALLVLLDPAADGNGRGTVRAEVVAAAQGRGLKLVADGLERQPGVLP
jgi:hypothetical protein